MKILRKLNLAKILYALLFGGFLIITAPSCKKANGVNGELLRTLSSKKSEEFGFGMSMPARIWNDSLPDRVVHYLIINDSSLLNLCRKVEFDDVSDDLLDFLDDPDLAWQANLVLFDLTESDALTMSVYRPNKVSEWKKEKWPDHKRMWRKMFAGSK